MKFKTTRENLLKGIYAVQNVVSPKTTLPILANILIESQKNQLRLMGTDLDIGISCVIPVETIEEGSITIPAKRFGDIIKESPDGIITIIARKNNFVEIECNSCRFKLGGIPKEEFPKFPEFRDKEAIRIEQNIFKEMLQLTSFAVSHEETRYVLNGILLEVKKSKIRLVATDSRRLALVERDLNAPSTKDINIIIPSKATNELVRNLQETGDVSLVVGDNQVLFQIDDILIASRIIEGEFPNYAQAIPKPTERRVVVDRNRFISAIKRANLLSTPDYKAVKLEIFKNKLIVSKSTPELGESREELEIEYNGKELIIGFNPHYLLDVLRNIDQDTVSFEMTDPEKPAVLRLDNYLYLVLPMRL
jgi:DNA polymerase-3 subunit beta